MRGEIVTRNVEIWVTDARSGKWTILNEYRAENAAVFTEADYERLKDKATTALSGWRKVYPDDRVEMVLVTRAAARQRQRRQKIASVQPKKHSDTKGVIW